MRHPFTSSTGPSPSPSTVTLTSDIAKTTGQELLNRAFNPPPVTLEIAFTNGTIAKLVVKRADMRAAWMRLAGIVQILDLDEPLVPDTNKVDEYELNTLGLVVGAHDLIFSRDQIARVTLLDGYITWVC